MAGGGAGDGAWVRLSVVTDYQRHLGWFAMVEMGQNDRHTIREFGHEREFAHDGFKVGAEGAELQVVALIGAGNAFVANADLARHFGLSFGLA